MSDTKFPNEEKYKEILKKTGRGKVTMEILSFNGSNDIVEIRVSGKPILRINSIFDDEVCNLYFTPLSGDKLFETDKDTKETGVSHEMITRIKGEV